MTDPTDEVQKQIDTAEEAPPEDECDQGSYLMALTYEHKECGARIAMATPPALHAGMTNATIRVKCQECGVWVNLKPAQKIQLRPPQAKNRKTRRTPGGIIVPR